MNNDGKNYIVGHTETYVKGYVPAEGLGINQMKKDGNKCRFIESYRLVEDNNKSNNYYLLCCT